MNAYELAKYLYRLNGYMDMPRDILDITHPSADMLIQQAKRIEELEKINNVELNKGGFPVSNATYWKRQYNLMSAQNDRLKSGLYHANEHIKYLESINPHKELSDEEIDIVAEKMADMYNQLRAKESGSRGYAEQCDTMKTIYNAIIKASRSEK